MTLLINSGQRKAKKKLSKTDLATKTKTELIKIAGLKQNVNFTKAELVAIILKR